MWICVNSFEYYVPTIDLWQQPPLDLSPTLAAESRSTSWDRGTAALGQAGKPFSECVVCSRGVAAGPQPAESAPPRQSQAHGKYAAQNNVHQLIFI